MPNSHRLKSFAAFGIELEYMLVDVQTLDVRPIADLLLETAAGKPTGDFESGAATWSNELALHVIELKGSQPVSDLRTLVDDLQTAIANMAPALRENGIKLLPTGMHPWMNPAIETKLWPHEYSEIYNAYHAIFNCHSHGWANVQSVHLNLPFSDDEEFARLHAAARILLPILPALTASSPIYDGRWSGWKDARMKWVRSHCDAIPFLTGEMIPEPIFDEATYREQIFGRLKQEIQPHDPGEVFDANFLNARGAIARFDRGSIEIRVMDVQECPRADIAVCVLAIGVLKALVAEHWQPLEVQQSMATTPLSKLLDSVSQKGERATISDPEYLLQFGETEPLMTHNLWRELLTVAETYEPMLRHFRPELDVIMTQGSLSTRIENEMAVDFEADEIKAVYQKLVRCLEQGQQFV